MTMGNIMSRLAMILRRTKVAPNQNDVPQKNRHERCDKQERMKEKNEPERQQCISNVQIAAIKECCEVFSVLDGSEVGENSQQVRTNAQDIINNPTVENYFTDGSCDPEQNSNMKFSRETVENETTYSNNNNDKQTLCPTEAFIEDSEDLHDTEKSKFSDISTENTLNIETSSNPADCSGPVGNLDSLSCISKDGYSTEGTAGTEEGSLGDGNDVIIDTLLIDNIDDDVDDNFDINETEIQNGRKSALTPQSLETFNNSELDKRECVRSYIQAWSQLNLPTADTTYSNSLPGACAEVIPQGGSTSPEPYDRLRSSYDDPDQSISNERRELHEVDSQEYCLFYQRSPETMYRPLSDSWDALRYNRAPWINIGSAGSEEVLQGRGGYIEDVEDSGWPKAMGGGGHDPNNRLTLCSLSTINEESDDREEIELLAEVV